MGETLDMRGKKCPQPVIETKKALEHLTADALDVIVDNDAARDNIMRFATFKGFHASSRSEKAGEYVVSITKSGEAREDVEEKTTAPSAEPEPEIVCDGGGERVILITSAGIGEDNEILARELMTSFLDVLTQATRLPDKMLFMNSGVRLTVEGSPVLDTLRELEEKGIKIFSCGRCLEFLHLKDELRVGQVTNMYETVENVTMAGSVIKI